MSWKRRGLIGKIRWLDYILFGGQDSVTSAACVGEGNLEGVSSKENRLSVRKLRFIVLAQSTELDPLSDPNISTREENECV